VTGGVITAALKHLMAAGITGEALLAAVADLEEAQRPTRSAGARRQADYRERLKAVEATNDITSDVTDVTHVTSDSAPPSPKKLVSIPPTHSPPIAPPFPISAALDVWNGMAERTGLPKAIGATGKRLAGMKERLAEHGKDGWCKAVEAVERSAFCRGENDRGWRADIGFMIRPEKFLKLLEGGFDKAGAAPKAERPPMTAAELRNAIRFAEDHDDPDRAAECRRQLEELQGATAPRSTGPPSPTSGMVRNVARSLSAHQPVQ
jgi:hypothetical protein